MAEAVSIIGFIASIAQLASNCLQTIQILEHVRQRIRSSSTIIESLISESLLVYSSLSQLKEIFQNEQNTLTEVLCSKPDLLDNIKRTLRSCECVWVLVRRDVEKLETPIAFVRIIRLVIRESVMNDYLSQIRGHQTALTLLIQGLQM
jgi:hypothetical protein